MEPGDLFDNWLEGTVHRESQVDALGVHLTVAQVLATHKTGRIDFGGSEFKASPTHDKELVIHTPGDKYAWWRLEEGVYIVRFNERVRDGAPPVLLTANSRLLDCGCSLTAKICGPGELRSTLIVPEVGLQLKQNARIALLASIA